MKLFGKILAAVIAGLISVIVVQRLIRRVYTNFGKKYIDLSPNDGEENPLD